MSKKVIQIGKIAKLNFKTLRESDNLSVIQYLDTGNITKDEIQNLQILNIKQGRFPSRAKRRVKENTIIYSTVRPNQKHYGILKSPNKNLIVSTGFTTIDIINKKNDPKFIYYLLTQNQITEHLHKIGMNGTSSYPSIKPEDIGNLKFIIPENIQDQQKIASVFSTIDSKIELNNKINTELEQMAKTLYDYWFVQFDFPVPKNSPLEGWTASLDGVEETKPYKTSGGAMVYSQELKRHIPKGWEVKKISDLLPVITGKQDANFATENGEYNFFTCGEEILKCNSYEFEGKAVLIAGNGNFGIKLYEGKFNAYQRTYILMPNNEKHYTIIYLAVKDKIQSFKNSSRGSIIKFITKGDIENILIPLPKDKDLDVFTQLNNITEKIEKNLEENQKLAELRDFLLPMLMNGQIVVE
jgi:type I restriction enzyme S subunit